MIIIIPLGGTGERFKKNGYKKSGLETSLRSLLFRSPLSEVRCCMLCMYSYVYSMYRSINFQISKLRFQIGRSCQGPLQKGTGLKVFSLGCLRCFPQLQCSFDSTVGEMKVNAHTNYIQHIAYIVSYVYG